MSELAQRILNYSTQLGLSKNDLANKIGVSPAVLSHIASGRNKPGLDLILSFLTAFPKVNPDWLLFGHGPESREGDGETEKIENIKLLLEVKLLNEMNYNVLKEKIENLERRIKGI